MVINGPSICCYLIHMILGSIVVFCADITAMGRLNMMDRLMEWWMKKSAKLHCVSYEVFLCSRREKEFLFFSRALHAWFISGCYPQTVVCSVFLAVCSYRIDVWTCWVPSEWFCLTWDLFGRGSSEALSVDVYFVDILYCLNASVDGIIVPDLLDDYVVSPHKCSSSGREFKRARVTSKSWEKRTSEHHHPSKRSEKRWRWDGCVLELILWKNSSDCVGRLQKICTITGWFPQTLDKH